MKITSRLDASYQRKESPEPERVRASRALDRAGPRVHACGLTPNSRPSAHNATPPRKRKLLRQSAQAVRWKVLRNSPPTKSPFGPAPSEARSISGTPDREQIGRAHV